MKIKYFSMIAVLLLGFFHGINAQFTAPIMDGEIDDVWGSTNTYALGKLVKNNLGPLPESSDISASFSTLWDEDNFYLLVEVTDNQITNTVTSRDHQNDNIEVYLDLNNSKLSIYDGIDDDQIRFIPGIDTVNSKRGVKAEDLEFAYSTTTDGYLFEIRFPWTVLSSESFVAATEVEIGFDLMATDNDNSDSKDYIYAWNSPENDAWQNTQIFGILKLNSDGTTVKVASPFMPAEHDALEIDESNVEVEIYVDQAHIDASDSNAGDDPALPLLSLGRALEVAADSLGEGKATRIMVSPGVYREYGLAVTRKGNPGLFMNTELVIEGTEKGKVIISGSELFNEGWTNAGNRTYSRNWPWTIVSSKPWGDRGPSEELAQRRENIFVNGYWMEQVLSEAALKDNSFYVDEANDLVYVRVADSIDFLSANKEISLHGDEEDLPWPPRRLFTVPVEKDKVVLRNLVFQHANMRLSEAAVKIQGWKVLMDNCVVQWNNGLGVSVSGGVEYFYLKDSKLNNNGGSGMTTWGLINTELTGSETSYNNWRGHLGNYHSHAIGGIKFHHTRNILVKDHKAVNNQCAGLWADLEIIGAVFDHCHVENNRSTGILVEISSDIEIKNSTLIRNAPGVRCHSAHDVTIDSCSFEGNVVHIAVYRDHRDFTSSDWTSQFEGRVWDKTPKNWTIRNSHFHAVDEPQWQANNEYRIPSWMHYTSPGYQPFWHFSHSEYMLTFYGAADIAYNNNEWVHDAVELAFKDDKGNDLDVNAWEEWISGILSNEEALAVIDAYAREDDASPLTLSQLENAGAQDIIDDNLEVYKVVIEDEESIPDLSSLQNVIDAANAFAVVRSFADSDDASGLTVQLLLDCGISFRSDRMEYYKTAIAGVESADLPDIAALQALIDITTGMEKDRSMQVFVYPNPFTDIIRINGMEGICALEIMDTSGKLLYRFTGTIPGSLDLTELDSGLYLVRIKGEEEIRMQKLIKK